MKNKKNLAGLFGILVLICGLILAGCPNDGGGNGNGNGDNGNGNANDGGGNGNSNGDNGNGDNGNGNEGEKTLPAAKGKMTINGLTEYNGKYIYLAGVAGDNLALVGFMGITGYPSNTVYTLPKISNGNAVVPLYLQIISPNSLLEVIGYTAYNGNDTVKGISIFVMDDDDGSFTQTEFTSALSNSASEKTMKAISSGTFSNGDLTVSW